MQLTEEILRIWRAAMDNGESIEEAVAHLDEISSEALSAQAVFSTLVQVGQMTQVQIAPQSPDAALLLSILLYELSKTTAVLPQAVRVAAHATCAGLVGKLLVDTARPQQALKYIEESVARYREVGASDELAGALLNLAVAYRKLGRHEEGVTVCEEALRTSSTGKHEPVLFFTMGNLHLDGQRFDQATSCYGRAAKAARQQGSDNVLVLALLCRNQIRQTRDGKHAVDISELNEAAKRASEIGMHREFLDCKDALARGFLEKREFPAARTAGHEALRVAREISDPHAELALWSLLVEVETEDNNIQAAIDAARTGAELAAKIGNIDSERYLFGLLADLHQRLGDSERAQLYGKKMLAADAKDRSDRLGKGFSQKFLGRTRVTTISAEALGDDKNPDVRRWMGGQILGPVAQAADGTFSILPHAGKYRAARWLFRNAPGWCLLKHDRIVKAWEQASQWFYESGFVAEAVEVKCRLADVELQRDNATEALQRYVEAIDLVETERSTLETSLLKQSYLDRYIWPFEQAIGIHVAQGRSLDALKIAEKFRAREAVELLSVDRHGESVPVACSPLSADESLDQEMADCYATLRRLSQLPEDGDERVKRLESELRSLEQQWADRCREQGSLHRSAETDSPERVLTRNALASLVSEDGHIIVCYFVGTKRSFVWVVGKDTLHTHVIEIGEAELQRTIDGDYLSRFALHELTHEMLADPSRIQKFLKTSRRLSSLLLEPLEDWLQKATRITFIPAGPLFYLPFEALPIGAADAADFQDTRFLGERVVVDYAPSIASRILLHSKQAQRASSQPGAGLALAAFGGVPAMDRSTCERSADKDSFADDVDRLPYLESSVDEVVNAVKTFAEGREIVRSSEALVEVPGVARGYLGDLATKENVLAEMRRASTLHLAAHGLLDDSRGMYSAVVLAPSRADPITGGDGNCCLYAFELLGAEIAADLVVLSACHTASGALRRGEGVLGLVRSLLLPGAKAVVASLWSVADDSTATLMGAFYDELARGCDTSTALHKAKQSLLRQAKYRDPFYWAAFIHMGVPWKAPLPEGREPRNDEKVVRE